MTGFIVLAGYGGVLWLLHFVLRKQNKLASYRVANMVFADGKVSSPTLLFSVFSAWLWTTSIFGAAEAYELYGVLGSLAYAGGAAMGFAIFVPFLCRIRESMPEGITYLEHLQHRYGANTKMFFYIFAFLVSAYVMVEQAVGIASMMDTLFGSPFKMVAFLSIAITTVFICATGMKGLLANEKLAFFVILSGVLIFTVYIFGFCEDFNLTDESARNSLNIGGSMAVQAFRYFVMAIVIAFGQLILDPAYYIKGKLARNTKSMKKIYLLSGVFLWGTFCFVISTCLGWMAHTREVSILELFSGGAALCFSIIIAFVGMGTVAHFLMGMMGVFAVDYYTSFLRTEATEKDKLVFARVMTIAMGIFCALIAISLEDISLLTIDSFCAIFFAAPSGPVVMSFMLKRKVDNIPIFAASMGIILGVLVWIYAGDDSAWAQFAGMGVSLIVPVIVLLIGNGLSRRKK